MKQKWSYTGSLAFLPLLPVFFVFHGYVDFFDLITPEAALELIIQYLLLSTGLLLFNRWLLGSWERSAIFTFSLLAADFFFGSTQDLIKINFSNYFINRYTYQLSFLSIILVLIFIALKKQKQPPIRLIRFLNYLFPVLLIVDSADLLIKIKNKKSDPTIGNRTPLRNLAKNTNRPDIYFIITDGYSGSRALASYFMYDNSPFEKELKNRGFYVVDSSFSNYNYTVFSVASTLNMDYLMADGFFNGRTDLPRAFKALRDNPTTNFLEEQGYEIYNYSIFDLVGHPTSLVRRLMKYDQSPITTQTLTYRTWNDIGYHLFNIMGRKNDIWAETLNTDYNNNVIADSLAIKLAKKNKKASPPFFCYTHLVMPHVPYYFDSLGNRFPNTELNENSQNKKDRYINYLVFTNKKLLHLVDQILINNGRPAIIILLGDHGARDCLQNKAEEKAQAINLNAVFFPEKEYAGFYKGISNVNEFRVIFNSYFDQKLPLIKDSSVHIKMYEALLH